MMTSVLRIGAVAALSIGGAACSDDTGQAESTSTTSSTSATSAPSDPISTDETVVTTQAVDTVETIETIETVETVVPATDVTDVPTTDASVTSTAFDLATLPALIANAETAISDPTITPLGVAQAAIGFPYDIPVLDGSTLAGFSGALTSHDADGDGYSFGYWAIAPDGTVPDIDVTLADNGPGSAQIVDVWDPIMQALGFERTNSTASDPGDPGGPNSVNHVFVATSPERSFNGVDGEVSPVFVWSDEDITGASYRGGDALGGYRVNLEVSTAASAGIPFPIVNALLDVLPRPDGLIISGISIDLRTRESSAFDADKGLTYITVHLEWEAPAEMLDRVVAFYADPQAVFTDGPTIFAGEADFFDDGSIVAGGLTDYDGTDKRLSLILLQRYAATLGIDASDDGVQPMTISFDLSIDSIAPELALPAG